MTAQWMGLDNSHANSVAPVLVSGQQGWGKSSFCRSLLPPELAAYYTDSVDMANTARMEQLLTGMGLICLDEFDRIPARRHPALKNVMQLTTPARAQGLPARHAPTAPHRLLHRHLQQLRTARGPFGQPQVHLRGGGAPH